MEDIDALIKANKGLVYAQLKKFYLIDDPDAESLAYEALANGIQTYDPTKGAKLSTYATCCIYNALGSYVRYLKSSHRIHTVSYDALMSQQDHQSNDFRNVCLADEKPDPLQKICDAEMLVTVAELSASIIAGMTNEKQRLILQAWKDSAYTALATDIARKVDVSQSYVSQVIMGFKHKLKVKLEELYL